MKKRKRKQKGALYHWFEEKNSSVVSKMDPCPRLEENICYENNGPSVRFDWDKTRIYLVSTPPAIVPRPKNSSSNVCNGGRIKTSCLAGNLLKIQPRDCIYCSVFPNLLKGSPREKRICSNGICSKCLVYLRSLIFFFPTPPLEYKYIFNEGWWINYNFTPRYATTWLYLINLRRYYNHSSENSKYVFFFFFFPLSAGNEVRISLRIGEDSEISGAACVFGTISRTILKKFVVLKIFYLRLVCRYRLFF